jgi:hypothetical protein
MYGRENLSVGRHNIHEALDSSKYKSQLQATKIKRRRKGTKK